MGTTVQQEMPVPKSSNIEIKWQRVDDIFIWGNNHAKRVSREDFIGRKMEVKKTEATVNSSQLEAAYMKKCRLCLKNYDQLLELFQNGDSLPLKIMAVASVEVERADGLPSVICFSCHQLLDMSYNFKCQIEKSDAALHKILFNRSKINPNVVKESLARSVNNDLMEHESRLLTLQNINHIVSNDYHDSQQDLVTYEITEDCISGNNHLHEERTEEKNKDNELDNVKHAEKGDDISEPEIIPKLKRSELLPENHGVSMSDSIDIKVKSMQYESEPIKLEDLVLPEESDMPEGEEDDHQADEIILYSNHLEFKLENNLCSGRNDEADNDSFEANKFETMKCKNSIGKVTDNNNHKNLNLRLNQQEIYHCINSFPTNLESQSHMTIHENTKKLRYTCYWCEKQFYDITQLMNHVSNNHDSLKNDNRDNKCGRVETNRKVDKLDKDTGGLIDKQKIDKKNYKLKCKVCVRQFTYQKSFFSHIKTHPDYEKTVTADNYSEELETIEESLEHQNDLSNSKINESDDDDDLPLEGLQCTQCGKLFATKGNLKRHILTHSGLKFNCSTYGNEFSQLDELKDHEQSKQKEEIFDLSSDEDEDTDNEGKPSDSTESRKKEKKCRPHQCALCPKAFAKLRSLANHMEWHKRAKDFRQLFLCEVCNKSYAHNGSLAVHMRTHTGVKPYVCNVCGRGFTKNTYLQHHLRTHSGEKPYICQYCNRAFARSNTLVRHTTMHTGEAKYHCQICMKSFRRLTSLKEHTYTHTGQRPYTCKICSKQYNRASSLYEHTKGCRGA